MAFSKKVEQIYNATDIALAMQVNTQVAIFSAFASLKNPGQTIDLAAIKTQFNAQAQQMRPTMEQYVIMNYAYSYKGLNKSEQTKYEKFINSEVSMKFMVQSIKGFNKSFDNAVNRLADQLAKIMGQHLKAK